MLLTQSDLRTRIQSAIGPDINDLFQSQAFAQLVSDELDPRQFHYVLAQYAHYVEAFPQILALTASRLDCDEARLPLIENLWEEHGDGDLSRSHRRLYRNFLAGLRSAPLPEGLQSRRGEAVATFVDNIREHLDKNSIASMLGLMGPGTEEMTAALYERILRSIKLRFEYDEQALDFFEVHIELDEEHAEAFLNVIHRHIMAEGEQALEDVISGAKYALREEHRFWHAILEEAECKLALVS